MKRIKKLFSFLLLMTLLVMIPSTVYAKAPTLSKKSLTVGIGGSIKLKVKNAGKKKVKWSSSDKTIATVSSKGNVKGKKEGTAVITAKVGKKSLQCKVTVKAMLVPMKQLANYQYFRNYMSESQLKKSYKAAAKIVKPLLGKSKEEQMIGIAVGLRSLFESGMKYSMKAKHYNDPYGYFIKKCASCAGCTRATGLCLNMLGYKYEHVNENQYSHQWARVKVGKQYWIVDAFGLYVGKEPAKRKHPYLS